MADDGFDDVEGTPDLVPRAHIRDLEAKARRADELEAQLAQAQRDAAFTQALGTSTDPRLDYFRRGYQGDVTPEAIREAATTAGFLATESQPPPAANPPAGVAPQDLAAHARMAAASDGAGGASAPPDLHAAIAAATSEAEVLALLEGAQGQAAGLRTTRQNQ
jgi:hypothetical protein